MMWLITRIRASDKYYVIRHLILVKIQNIIDINVFYTLFEKKSSGDDIESEIMQKHIFQT